VIPFEEVDKKFCLGGEGKHLAYFARNILGYDYFKSERSGRVTHEVRYQGKLMKTCGVVDWGPHKAMVDFLCSGDPALLLMTSRGSLKTTIVTAKIIHDIIRDPDVRILLHMEMDQKARETIRLVKTQFERNERLREMFGDFVGKKWTDAGFIVQGRKRESRDFTLASSGTDKVITGNHFDKIYIDDPVSWQQALSTEGMKKAIACYKSMIPILDPGGQMIVTMTPYDDQDLSCFLKELGTFQVLEVPCGMKAVDDNQGGYRLQGEPVFPHLPEKELKHRLRMTNDPREFNTQYALTLQNPMDQVFFRNQFQEAELNDRLRACHAYVLTDTAVANTETACFSVIAVVILDWDDTAYLADMRVGKWTPDVFEEEFLSLVKEWQPQVRIVGAAMENVTANRVYRASIDEKCRERGIRFEWIHVPRGVGEPVKHMRVRSLISRFHAKKFRVLSTVPETFENLGRIEVLWDPVGYHDPETGDLLPAGELVNQFINFRYGGGGTAKLDIPDALADLEAMDKKGRRLCQPSPRPGVWATESKRRLPQQWGHQRGRDHWSELKERIG
jgi:hypothetical protein